jgi:hypothetical protein
MKGDGVVLLWPDLLTFLLFLLCRKGVQFLCMRERDCEKERDVGAKRYFCTRRKKEANR